MFLVLRTALLITYLIFWCWQQIYSFVIILRHCQHQSRDSLVGIATGYGLDDRGVGIRVPVESRIFSMSRPITLVPEAISLGVKGAGAWSRQLTFSYCWSPENVNVYIHSPIRLHGVELNKLSTGTDLPFTVNTWNYSIECLGDWWSMMLKYLWRKLLRPNRDIVLIFAWWDWGKPRNASAKICGFRADIRTEYFLNSCQEVYR
jgi:hypothetical protein